MGNERDVVIYVLPTGSIDMATKAKRGQTGFNPFLCPGVARFEPPHVTKRIVAQSGSFTIHAKPNVAFDSDAVERVIIRAAWSRRLQARLSRLGVNRASLFPDLDGIAGYLDWHLRSGETL